MTVERSVENIIYSEKENTTTLERFPAIHMEVFETEKGTLYLKGPGVVMISARR